MKRFTAVLCFSILPLLVLGCPGSIPLYSITELHLDIQIRPNNDSLNNDGAIVAVVPAPESSPYPWAGVPVVWRDGIVTPLPIEPADGVLPVHITSDGTVLGIGYKYTVAPIEASYSLVRWIDGQQTAQPHAQALANPVILGTNDALQAVGRDLAAENDWYVWDFSTVPFTAAPVPVPEGTTVSLADINNAGQIVGWYADPEETPGAETHVCIWDDNGRHELSGFPAELSSPLVGLNDQGTVLGWNWVWKNGQLTNLQVPEATEVVATDINNKGWIVGWAVMSDLSTSAVLWKPTCSPDTYNAVSLNDRLLGEHEITLSEAYAINDHNEILAAVGGTDPPQYVLLKAAP